MKEKYYKALADKVGGEQGKRIAEAIRDMYTLYKPEMIDWFAELYDPTVGGYYYSNGAKDNEKIGYQGVCYDLRPDTESTEQALRFIKTSGLLGDSTLNEKQKEIFEKFNDCFYELADINEREIFVYAFKLGTKIAIESIEINI